MCVTAVLSVAVPSLGPFIMRHYGLGQMVVLRYSGLDLDRQKREMRGSWIMNLITESGADVQYLNRGKLPINLRRCSTRVVTFKGGTPARF